jgi:hypothetical protein
LEDNTEEAREFESIISLFLCNRFVRGEGETK